MAPRREADTPPNPCHCTGVLENSTFLVSSVGLLGGVGAFASGRDMNLWALLGKIIPPPQTSCSKP